MSGGRVKAELTPATQADVAEITAMIRELAVYEKMLHEAKATEEDMRRALFDQPPAAHAIMARVDGAVVGFSLYFFTFSTFVGLQGIWLEDLYVRPDWRSKGIGGQMMANLARIAVARGLRRLEWSVLNWNQPAIDVYTAVGAKPKDDWTVMRLTGESLTKLAAKAG